MADTETSQEQAEQPSPRKRGRPRKRHACDRGPLRQPLPEPIREEAQANFVYQPFENVNPLHIDSDILRSIEFDYGYRLQLYQRHLRRSLAILRLGERTCAGLTVAGLCPLPGSGFRLFGSSSLILIAAPPACMKSLIIWRLWPLMMRGRASANGEKMKAFKIIAAILCFGLGVAPSVQSASFALRTVLPKCWECSLPCFCLALIYYCAGSP
jgi:hypothetical protein